MGKKQSENVRITFLCKTSQAMSAARRRGTKEHLFYRTFLSGYYCAYFLLELKRVDVRLKKKKMNFYKETLKKILIILKRTKNK